MTNLMAMSSGATVGLVLGIIAAVVMILLVFIMFATRYKKCPSDKIMVVYGGKLGKKEDGQSRPSKCIHGGARMVWPFFQAYAFLDLTPISINVDLRSTLSKQNIRVDVPSRFTVGISTESGVMQNAAERLLGLKLVDIQDLAKDIILGQLRLVIALMDIEDINTNRDRFLDEVSRNVETELKKIGLRLINVNVTDINDESGYIQALGKEAAAKAINDAKRSVAEKNRDGAIGEANALKDERINVAVANSIAVEGENESRAKILESNAKLKEVEAEATRRAEVAESVAQANARKEAYLAEELAEKVRADKERSTQEADILVKAEINKRRIETEAEAEAEKLRRNARGQADAIYAVEEAKARGLYEILSKQAEGFKLIVSASGGKSDDAVKMLIADKIEELVSIQVEAIKNIKIDKITVWDGGKNATGDNSTTANFVSGLVKSVPPLSDLFGMVGMEVPKYLGKVKEEPLPPQDEN